jgi:hypothetical protein
VDEADKLVVASDYQGVRLFASRAEESLYGSGTELISSFILNVADRSLSRDESVITRPIDSLPIPPPSKWTASYNYSINSPL